MHHHLQFPLTFIFLSAITFTLAISDEYYCQHEEDQYKICRSCPDLRDERCEKPTDNKCRCDNIAIADPDDSKFEIIFCFYLFYSYL